MHHTKKVPVNDFRFVLSTCFEDARRSRARTISYRWAVIGTPETHHGDIKAVSFKEKNEANPTKSGNKTPSVPKADVVICQFCGKNNHSNANCRTRTSKFTNNQNRPYIGSEAHSRLVKAAGDRDWIPNFKELKGLMSKAEPEYILSALHIESNEPNSSQYSKIGMMHNSIVGHFRIERTLKRFKDLKDTWEYQRQHIRYYIDHCTCCQKMNMLKIPIHAHGFTTSMECLNIDFIGPFPDQGYILVIVDTFTRWVGFICC